jgi:hypothetical protein
MNKIAIAAVALCGILLTGALSSGPATAGPIGMQASAGQSQSLVQQTQYYHRGWRRGWRRGGIYIAPGVGYGYGRRYGGCGRARRICAVRWGWGGPGFRRCMWRHGC